jgi:aminoglycoside 6'-N-acetyltransferase
VKEPEKHPALLTGTTIQLRLASATDVDRVVEIRSTPEVFHRWIGDDLRAEFLEDIVDDGVTLLVIESLAIEAEHQRVIGAIQWHEETDPMYRHAGLDLYVDPKFHGRGYGTEAIALLISYLIDVVGHQRFVIDPAADNAPAIACYTKVGFRVVGRMRRYEQAADGSWHDGLLMDLLAEEFIRPTSPKPA